MGFCLAPHTPVNHRSEREICSVWSNSPAAASAASICQLLNHPGSAYLYCSRRCRAAVFISFDEVRILEERFAKAEQQQQQQIPAGRNSPPKFKADRNSRILNPAAAAAAVAGTAAAAALLFPKGNLRSDCRQQSISMQS